MEKCVTYFWCFSLFSFAVSLQPFEYDPLEKNRHKFMVQAMYAPEGEINSDSLVRRFNNTLLFIMWDEKERIIINSFCGRAEDDYKNVKSTEKL